MRSLNATLPAPGPAWDAHFLAFILPLTPEDVLHVDKPTRGAAPGSRFEWAWISTAQRLVEAHGADEALRRLNGYGR